MEDNQESYVYTKIWLPAGTYTASANVVASDGTFGSFVVRDTATYEMINSSTLLDETSTFTVTKAQEYEILLMTAGPCLKDTVTTFTNFQLELGTEKTSFEPYTEQVVKANADGYVTGLTSVSPSMTIFTDANVEINCEYQKKN